MTNRASVLAKLLESVDQIHSSRVYRAALWIIGEYSESSAELRVALSTIKKLTGNPRIQAAASQKSEEAPVVAKTPSSTGPRVLADGTYATSSALTETPAPASGGTAAPEIVSSLHSLLIRPDPFLGAVLAVTLTKLSLKIAALPDVPRTPSRFSHFLCFPHSPAAPQNRVRATTLLYLTSLLRLATGEDGKPIDKDSFERFASHFLLLSRLFQYCGVFKGAV